jgi:hypothetical protein
LRPKLIEIRLAAQLVVPTKTISLSKSILGNSSLGRQAFHSFSNALASVK